MKPNKLTKKEILELKKQEFDKYTIAGLWLTMGSFVVFMFIKEFLLDHYLINFSIDLLVAVVGFYMALNNFKLHYHAIQEYKLSKKAFHFELFGLIMGLLVTILTVKSPFDISFLILVVTHITSKKIVKKELGL